MRNKDLIDLYNEYLSDGLMAYQIKTWDDLSKVSLQDLKKLLEFFADLLSEVGLDDKGEVTPKGAAIDDIISQINVRMIQLKEN